MTWNRSRIENEKCRIGNGRKFSVLNPRLAIAAVAALAIVACICIALFRGEKRTLGPEAQGKSHLIADVGTNTVAKLPATESAPVRWPEKNPNRKDGIWRHGEGPRSVAVTNGVVVTYPNCPGVEMILPHPKYASPFRNISDNEIARIISARPGAAFVDVPLPRDFDRRFTQSLLEPIRIEDGDSPERANLKRQVMEARAILAQAAKNGESPRAILVEEAKNLRRLMGIRDSYQHMVLEQIRKGASDQEINDTVNAANRLLKEEGIKVKVRLPYMDKLRIDKARNKGTVQD